MRDVGGVERSKTKHVSTQTGYFIHQLSLHFGMPSTYIIKWFYRSAVSIKCNRTTRYYLLIMYRFPFKMGIMSVLLIQRGGFLFENGILLLFLFKLSTTEKLILVLDQEHICMYSDTRGIIESSQTLAKS